ncbi:MAG: PEP/pyruvate-binding domain-containing protein [Thermoleophilia bacterium]
MDIANAFRRIGTLLSPRREADDPEALKQAFQEHYRSLRSLLTANNNALELMAGMEEAYTRGQPFGMAFVRGHATALTVNVYKMIQNLHELSGGGYAGLDDSFARISAEIEQILSRQPAVAAGGYVKPVSELRREDADLAGDKMANLGEVRKRVGLRVPDGFVITAAATRFFMESSGLQDEINRILKTTDLDDLESLYRASARIQGLISGAVVPPALEEEILGVYRSDIMGSQAAPPVSMRSSAVGEDRTNVSFAGQYRTQLNVSEDLIIQTFKEIVASKYSSQAIVYRHQRGFRHQDVVMCVGCLAMVDAAVSGVMFSRSPGDQRAPWVEINAARGLATGVVDGSAGVDSYRVDREDTAAVEKAIAGDEPVLTPAQLDELAAAAVRLGERFGSPQDIEWSYDREGDLVVLQSRPLAEPREAVEAPRATEAGSCREGALLTGGLTASRGAVAGPVFRVNNSVDLLEFPRGSLLLVKSPDPGWATLLDRAAGVISDSGHVATHLAIVARELGLPALFGISGAFDLLENGREVTVDATGGCLYDGTRDDLIEAAASPPNLMEGSPVHRILGDILELVLPLNLTDPGSPYFKSTYCKTMHDITRFCHEKAVKEMFSFGADSRFDARSAKQLAGETPFQWWVIDLEDGFREGFDPREKFVFVQDIVSQPMLAIWEGMTAKPWQGPPPVNARGLGSILFRSTMNPSLDPSVRASLGSRNYFLVSKNFCNLSMRLGYHFALAEAYLGSHLTENYVSFQFRGGAADRSRRFERVYLLQDILERYGFRVEVKFDALTARIEKQPREYLVERLKVLGYLLIHTRQIDMVMGEESMVERYREKITVDLETIVAPEVMAP